MNLFNLECGNAMCKSTNIYMEIKFRVAVFHLILGCRNCGREEVIDLPAAEY